MDFSVYVVSPMINLTGGDIDINSDNGTAGSITLMNISTERKLSKTDAQVCST